jgi:hypothetical protein
MSEKPTDKTEPTPPVAPVTQEKDDKGRFKPKPSAPIPPVPPPEPAPTPSPPEKDELLDEIEAELMKGLKGQINAKELESLDQRMRIKMLRILAKVDNSKRTPPVDPTLPSPPIDVPIPTLAEINRADKYRADMLKQGSYLGLAQKWREGKK